MNQSQIVETGNTLSQIAAGNDMSLGELLELNPQFRSNPDLIHPGDVVRLAPAARHQAASGANPEVATTNAGGAVAPPDPGGALARIGGTQAATGGDGVTPAQLQQIAPYTDLSQVRWTELADALNQSMALANANTPERQAMFLAQMAHETAGFRTLEEYASGDAYEGRTDLGNTEPGDGRRFKGRGFIQLTGRHNYTQASQALGIDLVSNPELAERPDIAARTAAWYWNNRNLNSYVDRGDFVGLTRAINGGTNGLADRQAYYARAKAALGGGVNLPDPGPTPNPSPNPNPGSSGGTYTVRSGDTLSGIASRHGTDWQTLARINNLSNPNLIHPGQRIRLPDGGNSSPGGSSGGTYTVRSGDTLSGIASRHGTDWQTLARINNLSNPNLIHPGQRITLPGGSNGSPGGPTPPAPGGNGSTYSPWTVYSTGHRPAFAVDHPDELQPHHDYQTRVRQGQTLEVRDVVLHRNGQSQTSQQVPSPVSGRVETVASQPGGAGNYVVLRSGSGDLVYLFHFSHVDVQQGQRISYGQDLGNQGSTGNSTGPHVHIEASSAIIDRWVHDLLDGRFDGRRT